MSRRVSRRAGQRVARPAAVLAAGTLTPGGGWRLPPPSGKGAGSGGRWGLVLGGGGVVGAAWLVGALSALEEARGVDARDAELIIGTSAGSVIGALLGAGVPVSQLREQQLSGPPRAAGTPVAPDAATRIEVRMQPTADRRGRLARLRPASPGTLTGPVRDRRRMPPTAVLAGLLPVGTTTMAGIRPLVESFVPAGEWAPRAGVEVVAVDYATGRREVFGAPGAPPAGLGEAVLASCAIPGWFTPVTIGGRRYVDGGSWSSTNLDLAAGRGLDEVIALMPMASFEQDRPVEWRGRLERGWRRRVTRRLVQEAAVVRRAGTGVTALGPGRAELELIGFDLMDPRTRGPVLESAAATAGPSFAPAARGDRRPAPAVIDLTAAERAERSRPGERG